MKKSSNQWIFQMFQILRLRNKHKGYIRGLYRKIRRGMLGRDEFYELDDGTPLFRNRFFYPGPLSHA